MEVTTEEVMPAVIAIARRLLADHLAFWRIPSLPVRTVSKART